MIDARVPIHVVPEQTPSECSQLAPGRCAAAGAATTPVRTTEHMERCRQCKRAVRFDLVNHPFFGFAANCDRQPNEAELSAGHDGSSAAMIRCT